MEITGIRLRKYNTERKMKAIASITFDNEFTVHGVKLIKKQEGYMVAMPSRRKDGEFVDIAHPINSEARKKITDAVLEAYENAEDTVEDTEEVASEDEENKTEE